MGQRDKVTCLYRHWQEGESRLEFGGGKRKTTSRLVTSYG